MKTDNTIVSHNFSRSSRTYAAAGTFQRAAARHLLKLIGREVTRIESVGKVLELGCGTGFLTVGLMRLFPDSMFVVSDISEEMLRLCMEVTRPTAECKNIPAYFECYNIADANIEKHYDLIVSSLAMQWVAPLNPVLVNAREHLRPGGTLVFSTLIENTFSVMHRVFAELGIPYPGPKLLSGEELHRQCAEAGFGEVHIESSRYQEEHKSLLHFLQQLQRTGAKNASGKPVSVTDMRRMIRRYGELEGDGPIRIEYQLAEAVCRL